MEPKPGFPVTLGQILTGLGSGRLVHPPLPSLPPGRQKPQLSLASAGITKVLKKLLEWVRQLEACALGICGWLAGGCLIGQAACDHKVLGEG